MSSDEIQSLKDSLLQYETQLEQINLALSGTSPGSEQEQLVSLHSDIEQLITLTKENLSEIQGSTKQKTPGKEDDAAVDSNDPFAMEYALFKAEIEQEERAKKGNDSNEDPVDIASLPDIKAELDALQGQKCQAPFSHSWGTSYHNALVFHVEPADNITEMAQIQVRVMFTNPTEMKMLPCTYYLEGECRFDDDKCRFSHGAIVHFAMLKEYKPPNFKYIKIGSRVLAFSEKDKLWHRGVVRHKVKDDTWEVRLETASGGKVQVELKHLLPLEGEDDDDVGSAVSSDDEGNDEDDSMDCSRVSDDEADAKHAALVQLSLCNNPSSALGNWEKHTKGFGSRMMQKMGYVLGTGLGPNGEGRIEPVEAVVLPPGKSLDHCMNLKSLGEGDNLIRAEKKMRRLKRKQEIQLKAQYEREKKQVNVFEFLNSKLGDRTASSSSASPEQHSNRAVLKTESNQGLNVANLRVGEEIRRAQKDLHHLQESLRRQVAGTPAHSNIASKVAGKERDIRQLQESERKIAAEQNKRKGNMKISVF